jgi:hypothetical protein
MADKPTWGTMGAEPGDKCSNTYTETRFTTPCCYTDVGPGTTQCPACSAPIECVVEMIPEAVCRIMDEADPEDDEEEDDE